MGVTSELSSLLNHKPLPPNGSFESGGPANNDYYYHLYGIYNNSFAAHQPAILSGEAMRDQTLIQFTSWCINNTNSGILFQHKNEIPQNWFIYEDLSCAIWYPIQSDPFANRTSISLNGSSSHCMPAPPANYTLNGTHCVPEANVDYFKNTSNYACVPQKDYSWV